MIQVFANYAGRTFQVTERKKSITDSDFLKFKIFNCIFMIVFGLMFCFVRGYDEYKIAVIIILILYRALDAYAESIFAIFQKNNQLYKCGISMTIKSITCVVLFLIIDIITNNLLLSVSVILLADVIIFCFYDLIMLKKYNIKHNKLKSKIFKFLLITGFSIFIMSMLSQYIAMAQKYIIDFFMTNEEQALFGIIIMPATFVGMCAAMIVNPFLYKMNDAIKNNKFTTFNKIVLRILFYVLLIGAITLIATYFIGIPVLNFIYNLELEQYLFHLLIIVIASVGTAVVAVLSNALIALRKNTSQMIIYIIASVFTTLISTLLILNFGVLGASLSYASTILLLLILYIIDYTYVIHNIKLLKV